MNGGGVAEQTGDNKVGKEYTTKGTVRARRAAHRCYGRKHSHGVRPIDGCPDALAQQGASAVVVAEEQVTMREEMQSASVAAPKAGRESMSAHYQL